MPEDLTIEIIPDLLNEAYLVHILWDADEGTLELSWGNCLIRNTDGTEIQDRTMLLRCMGVKGLAAGTDPLDCFARPSSLQPPGEIMAEWLKEGKSLGEQWDDTDASWLSVNRRQNEQGVYDSLRCIFLEGSQGDITGSPIRLAFTMPGESIGAGAEYEVTLLAGCEHLSIHDSKGEPEDLATWDAQFISWWSGWKKHWQEKPPQEKRSHEPAFEDTMIPAREDDDMDPYYSPPQEPPFSLMEHNVPGELLVPLRDWFEGTLKKDWLQVARTWVWGDEEVKRAQSRSSGKTVYSWGYARAVDEWWQEGNHAVVILRGIEHHRPTADSPARNSERVWGCALRCLQGKWILVCYTGGPFSQLPASRKPWLADWHSGKIMS